MGFDDCYQLGYIQKTHGLQGGVTILIDADFPEEYRKLESVLLHQSGQLVPFFIASINLQGNRAIVLFEGIDNLDGAKSLVGTELWLPLSQLPELGPGQYYFHELPGFQVIEKGKSLGIVKTIYQMPNSDLLAVDYDNHEILIPIQDEIILEVNKEKKTVSVELPEGLIDVYLEDNK